VLVRGLVAAHTPADPGAATPAPRLQRGLELGEQLAGAFCDHLSLAEPFWRARPVGRTGRELEGTLLDTLTPLAHALERGLAAL
jgi:hypothetical protein